MKTVYGLALLIALFFGASAEAGFSNSGTFKSDRLNLNIGGTLENDGKLIGVELANISCQTITGKGLIQSPEITIKADVFAYTGTIDCSGKCLIIVKTPFNEKMFKRTGGGEFIISLEENASPAKKALLSPREAYYITDGLFMDVE
ncbi:MAG: hypothetical protein ACK5MA_08275 [Parachlamydiaceae bacterium]